MLPPPEWFLVGFITSFCIALLSRSGIVRRGAFVILALSAGTGWAGWHASQRLSEHLPSEFEGRKVSVSGYVCDVPSPGNFHSLRFSLCVTGWHGLPKQKAAARPMPRMVRLAWYGAKVSKLPAHRLMLDVVLKRPHGTLNDQGFRYEDWLFRKGYRATGTVRAAEPDDSVLCGLHCHYSRAHTELARWVERRFADAEHLPLIASLLVGYRGNMTDAHWQILQATGTVHLVAISGLHLGLIALGAGLVFQRLLLVLPVSHLGEAARRRLLFGAVMLCCLVYALAAGFTVPTRRALLMVMVGGWSLLFARQRPAWHSLVLALATILFLDPFAPLDQGFWLSFGAVSVLICAFAGSLGVSGWFRALLVAQCAVFAGLWPVLQVFGQGQPLIGGLANLIAIPLVSTVVMPVLVIGGLLTAAVPIVSGVVTVAFDAVLDVLWYLLSALAQLPSPDLRAGSLEVVVLAFLVLAMICMPLRGYRVAGIIAILSWLGLSWLPAPSTNIPVSKPEVRIWDVGQGLAVLVRSGDKVLLYDTGPAVPGVFSSVESTLLPELRALGVHRIDTLVVSHADSDHAGGLALLADSLVIGQVVTGEVAEVWAKLGASSGFPVVPCLSRSEFLGELEVSYWQAPVANQGNDASCVMRLQHRASGIEWVFPGDISAAVESRYLTHLNKAARAQPRTTRVLLAPHHGSKTSSSLAWVDTLSPDVVIYSAGYRHRFGHPHPTVTARYRALGSRSFSTACSGMLVLAIAHNSLTIKEKRHDAPFWISGADQARAACKIP
ncbi:DNA internalization-related competence protein ComEC/Rec2 [Marinobacter sp. M216]|uniref:DNA internalization-related competence protein ComEC/Rec2 n=1 Tax=Marinobacter albus TaxID=3030833 RepID=A0ABT7HB75_9GAMM|nr:DNA internalization-related competence protein ComEC/Rec2 [Marinobacter sp. M216]MDK9557589.1 DNA internalization-related competence protein ComEC/Rec2 [Marinobacter sp. M216]